MENSDFLIAVILYVAIVAIAVCWFLVPRWIFGSRNLTIRQARLDLRNSPLDDGVSQRDPSRWRQARLFPDTSSR